MWTNEFLAKVEKDLNSTKVKRSAKPILNDPDVKTELSKLQKQYVFTPTDKAQNNVSIICKLFYHDMLKQELNSETYEKLDDTEDHIVDNQVNELKNLGIDVEMSEQKLPFIYWTAKQHKTPVSQRFIVSGKRCTTKSLSKKLLLVFQLLLKTLKNHCRYKCKFLKTKAFWIINNSKPLHQDMKFLNQKCKATSVFTYDFTRLYTNIPHDLLSNQLNFVLQEAVDIKSDKNI